MFYKQFVTIVFLVCCICFAYAATQDYSYWLILNVDGKANCNKNLLYAINLQSRFNAQKNSFERGVFAGGMGYQFFSNISLWLGYQWDSRNSITGEGQQNRIWQQVLWNPINNDNLFLSSRTRLEERKQADESLLSYRLRERVTIKFPRKIHSCLTPVIFDELFFNVNNPAWVNSRGFSQNRFFVGMDIPTTSKTFLEVGYMNQYFWRLTNNLMNHVAMITLNVRI